MMATFLEQHWKSCVFIAIVFVFTVGFSLWIISGASLSIFGAKRKKSEKEFFQEYEMSLKFEERQSLASYKS